MRRLIEFACAGETLVGTLDEASGAFGLLIVSGGNEPRMGAHRGMALLAARLAAAGIPVFRFDRRGVGDSGGENCGYVASAADISAAVATFRSAAPSVKRIAGFGNCDAATALTLFHKQAGIDRLILANPWVVEPTDGLPPAAAIRARYAERLRDPREWLRALKGGVDIGRLVNGLGKIAQKSPQVSDDLPGRLAAALSESEAGCTVLLAKGDNTAIAFRDRWASPAFSAVRTRVTLEVCDTASHSFARTADKAWLEERIRTALTEL